MAAELAQEGVAVPEHALERGTVGAEARVRLGEHLVEEVAAPARRALDEHEVVRREYRRPQYLEQATRAGNSLAVVAGAVTPAWNDVYLDLDLAATCQDVATKLRPGGALAHHRLTGCPSERLERRAVDDRLEQARLTGAVLTLDDGQPVRRRTEFNLVEIAEVAQLEPRSPSLP